MVGAFALSFRHTESLMTLYGVGFAVAGGAVMGALLSTDSSHVAEGDLLFLWLVPLLSLLFLLPALLGSLLLAQHAWAGALLVMANAGFLALGAAFTAGAGFPLGLVYLPGVILMWRGGSRALAGKHAAGIERGPRPFLVWTAAGIMPLLAFLLLASRWYSDCTLAEQRVSCTAESLGYGPLVFALGALLMFLLMIVGICLWQTSSRAGPLSALIAALPLLGAFLGLIGFWSTLALIGVL
ncbi:MAG TPA: hypothetical protein VNL15_05715, partial [Dehalococcoidia bacterium]|nr:hypothetical protein [Dehalococcoidia bacterium]